jgi:hypothetical protein
MTNTYVEAGPNSLVNIRYFSDVEMIAHMLHACYTKQYFSGLIGIAGRDRATKLMGKIAETHSHVAEIFKPGIIRSNKSEIRFANGSMISIILSPTSARGRSIDIIALHESQFSDSYWINNVYPTMTHSSFNPKVIIFT